MACRLRVICHETKRNTVDDAGRHTNRRAPLTHASLEGREVWREKRCECTGRPIKAQSKMPTERSRGRRGWFSSRKAADQPVGSRSPQKAPAVTLRPSCVALSPDCKLGKATDAANGEGSAIRKPSAGRQAAMAAKEAAIAARQAALAAQKKAREEHERAILPSTVAARAPVRREVPLRRPKVVVRVRPLAQSGGHSNEGVPVSKRLASWHDGTITLEVRRRRVGLRRLCHRSPAGLPSCSWVAGRACREGGLSRGDSRRRLPPSPVSRRRHRHSTRAVAQDEVGFANGSVTGVRSTAYGFAEAVLGPEAAQVDVHDAAAAELVRSVCTEGYNGLLFAYGQTGTGKTVGTSRCGTRSRRTAGHSLRWSRCLPRRYPCRASAVAQAPAAPLPLPRP